MAGTRNLSAVSLGDYKQVNWSYMHGIKNLSFRSKIPIVKVNTLQFLDPKRNICNIDAFTKRFNEQVECKNAYFDNKSEMRENIEAKFREAGIEKLFYEDIDNLLFIVENKTHLETVINVSQAFLEDDYRLDASQKTAFATKLIYSCYNLDEIEMAKHLWNQSYIDLHKGKWLNIFYYSWLFENGNYKEIVDHYSKIPDEERVNLEPLSLVILAALAKIETKEALDQMCIIREKSSYVNKIRSFTFSSWVAYKLKNYGLAYDLLTRANLKTRGLTIDNLKLAILVEVDKINEATIFLRTMLTDANDNPQRRLTICHDTMKTYTDAIRKTNDEELKEDAIRICQELDAKANLVESSLEEMIFRKVDLRYKFKSDEDKKFHKKPENSRDRNEMRRNVRVQEDNPRKNDFRTNGLPYN